MKNLFNNNFLHLTIGFVTILLASFVFAATVTRFERNQVPASVIEGQ